MRQLYYKNNYLVIALCLLLMGTSAASAQSVGIHTVDKAEGVEIQFSLPSGVVAKTFSLNNPPRLVVDIPNTGTKPEIRLPLGFQSDLIGKIRSGQFNSKTGRIVLEMNYAFTVASRQRSNILATLVSPKGSKLSHNSVASTSPSTTNISDTPAQPFTFKPATKTTHAPKPAPKPRKKTVVIDAGHGGKDPGTHGRGGTKEKEIVLKFAKELEKELERTGKYNVVLTREGDYYIALRERVKFARDNDADLFMSIHADSAKSSARGLSVYTLSETASDKEAAALARKENLSDVVAGVDLGDHDKDVANILISLAQRETNNQSAILADTLISSLKRQKIKLLARPHRSAGFAVLKAPDVPSVLVEIGFLSNHEEEKTLNNSSYRSKLAAGLTKAISHYFDTTSHAFE